MSTFAQLKDNVSLELGLDETASGDEDTLLGRRLNQGVREVLLRTKCRVTVATTSLTANEDDYELPSDVLAMNNAINDDGRPLERVSVEEIHELRRGTNPTATNVYRYAVDGANLLMLYPVPASAGVLTLYYVPKPTEMSSGSHDPSTATYGGIPSEYHDAIEYYALMRMSSYDDDSSSQMGMVYKGLFEEDLVRIRKYVRNLGGRKLGPARIGRPGSRRVPTDPSTDVYRG